MVRCTCQLKKPLKFQGWEAGKSRPPFSFAQASAKVPEVPALGRRDISLQSCSPPQAAGKHHSHAASRQLRELHEHHTRQGIHIALLSTQQSRTQPPFSTQYSCCQGGRWSPYMCQPDVNSKGLEGTVAFCRFTKYHVWSRNAADQQTSDTSSSPRIQLGPVPAV